MLPDLLESFQAYCPMEYAWTDSETHGRIGRVVPSEAVLSARALPTQAQVAPHLMLTDVPLFVSTSLTRLYSPSSRLSGIAERMLRAYINSMPCP